MSVLTSIQFYLPMGAGVLCLIMLMASLFGNSWRTVEYDGLKALELLDKSSLVHSIVVSDEQRYIAMNLTLTTASNASNVMMSFPMINYGGLWGSCDTIPDNVRPTLTGLQQKTQCLNYMAITVKESASIHEIDWELIRSAEVCAIVATVSFLTAAILGVFSVFRQQVVSALITGVCCLAAALYTLFVVILMHLKISKMMKDNPVSFPDEGYMRTVNLGWSLYLGWVALILITLDGVLWIFLSRKMSMVMMNYPPKYRQICSAYTA